MTIATQTLKRCLRTCKIVACCYLSKLQSFLTCVTNIKVIMALCHTGFVIVKMNMTRISSVSRTKVTPNKQMKQVISSTAKIKTKTSQAGLTQIAPFITVGWMTWKPNNTNGIVTRTESKQTWIPASSAKCRNVLRMFITCFGIKMSHLS